MDKVVGEIELFSDLKFNRSKKIVLISGPTTSTKERIEAAVTALAVEQQKEIQKLIEQQAKERQELKALFEQQQRVLITSVLNAVSPGSSLSNKQLGDDILADPESNRTDSNMTIIAANRENTHSPVIPTVKPVIEPSSLILPNDYKLPVATQTPENSVRFEKLSALIKGHLTRRLLKTAKVQGMLLRSNLDFIKYTN